jgi:V8-like Glu-specific endopeptidase
MRSHSTVGLACVVAVVWLTMPQHSWAGTCVDQVLAEELANAPNLTSAQRTALEERMRFLDGLAQAKPIPMRSQASGGQAVDAGDLVRFDLATGVAENIGAAFADEGGFDQAPGHPGAPLPGLGTDGGDRISDGAPGFAGGCTAPPLDYATWGFPWRTVVKLLMRFNVAGVDYFYVCSAATVNPFHLMTAGHCLFNWDPDDNGDESDARWADEVWAWPAQTDLVNPFGCEEGCPVEEDYPYGVSKAVTLYSYEGWTKDEDFDHDMAYIALDRRIGDRVGWMGAEAGVETNTLNFDGYPTETPYVPGCTIGPYPGGDEDNVDGYTEFRIELCAFIYGGHSGGPEWRFDGADRFIQGVNSTSDRMGSAEGTRLTVGKFDDLYKTIIPDDEANIPPVARPELIEYVLDTAAKDLLDNSVCKGTDFEIEYNGYNVGFVNTGSITVDFYLSDNTCISDADFLVGSLALGSIDANTFFNTTTMLTVPCNIPNGTYYAGWILSCATAEYNTDNNAVIISDETITITETGPPEIALNASGGEVDENCVFLAPYSAVITDDCGIDVSSIDVGASSLDGLATVGTPTVDINVVSPTEVIVSGTVEVSALIGCPANVRITVSAEDLCGGLTTESVDIQVDDNIAPTIAVELNRYELWPPNHKLVTIEVTVDASDNCPNTTWTLVSVTSDEPEDGTGDGDTAPDVVGADTGTPDVEFQLRSERAGNGDGRVYTIVYGVEDACGNTGQAEAQVIVPHDQSGNALWVSGLTDEGRAIDPNATSVVLVVPSIPPLFDAQTILADRILVGNTEGVVAPDAEELIDLTGDGAIDRRLTFPAGPIRELLPPEVDDLVGLHYVTESNENYLVPDILAPIGQLQVTSVDGVPDVAGAALTFLAAVAPNPAVSQTTVAFGLARPMRTRLSIYDVVGREVRLLEDAALGAGSHSRRWDRRDARGREVAAGLYIVKMVAEEKVFTQKVVIAK